MKKLCYDSATSDKKNYMKGDSIMRSKENPARMLWQLFKATFLLSAFTFGGGFVIVSLMKKKFVEELKWLEEEEMLDITAIAQSSPGPIPINASVILGYRMCGVIGSLVAILGTSLPPMIIISVISVFYAQFRSNHVIAIALQVMRAGVAAVIFDVVLNLAKKVVDTRRVLYIMLMVTAFVGKVLLGMDAMVVILCCLVVGLLDLVFELRSSRRKAVA